MQPAIVMMNKYIKQYFLLAIFFTVNCISVNAQTVGGNPRTSSVVEVYDDYGKPMSTPSKKNITGSPMLNPDWGSGTIFYKNGKIVQLIELQLNLQKNELYFRRDGKSYKFSDTITGFRLIYATNDLAYSDIFRSGYPVTGKNKATHFYQLLVDGKNIQLIADRSKQMVDAYTYAGGEKSTYREDEFLFVYDVANQKMIEIKNLKNSKSIITSAFPNRKLDIERICADQKLSMKKREDIIALIQGLQ